MGKSCILILLDGLGDRASNTLNRQTPLQAARTPHMDRLASLGSNGIFYSIAPGLALPSENAHFSMFGYNQNEFPGRGYLETVGAGINPGTGSVALLAHLAWVREHNNTLTLLQHRPDAGKEDLTILLEEIGSFKSENIIISYHQTEHLDGVLVMDGAVSPSITDSDPLIINYPLIEVQPLNNADPLAEPTAKALKSYLLHCYEKLNNHRINRQLRERGAPEINALVTQRAGQWQQVQSFSQRWGLRGVSISSGLVYLGMASFLGLDTIRITDIPDPGRELAERLKLACDKAKLYDFVHVHTKAPDIAGHSKDPRNKVKALESLDQGLGKVLDSLIDDDIILVMTSDHSTPSDGPLIHSGEAVPFTAVGHGICKDTVSAFDEVACANGALGTLNGSDFMNLVLNWLDRTKMQGLMDTPFDQPYWPGIREPFKLK